MSTPEITIEQAVQNLKFLTEAYLPGSTWTVGGAFRFDNSLFIISNFLEQMLAIRRFSNVAGSPPCSWNLDWFVQRRPIGFDAYCSALESYARLNIGVILVFDNPSLTEAALNDPYCLGLVQELYSRDRVRKNAVCVASDELAGRLRAAIPQLRIHCHPNRLVMEKGKRTPALYNKLAGLYDRVCLHPADAAKPSITNALENKEKFDIIINDSCLRTCPVRREHISLLADMRRAPYDTELMRRRSELISRVGCQKIDSTTLAQKASCNLTRDEATALYEAGFRNFVIQAQQFRNEMTLLWDIFQCMLDYSPEISNKAALIATSTMAEFGKPSNALPSGLRQFSFTNYE
ncbi:MAG: hypothetical protein J6R92_05135 [Akkermansia sp.]|nr:hypothetical protein [Akkermansia sp.]